jgi:hypothetical protein
LPPAHAQINKVAFCKTKPAGFFQRICGGVGCNFRAKLLEQNVHFTTNSEELHHNQMKNLIKNIMLLAHRK